MNLLKPRAVAFKGKLLDNVTIKQANNIVQYTNKLLKTIMIKFLDFESEIAQIEGRINELRHASRESVLY